MGEKDFRFYSACVAGSPRDSNFHGSQGVSAFCRGFLQGCRNFRKYFICACIWLSPVWVILVGYAIWERI